MNAARADSSHTRAHEGWSRRSASRTTSHLPPAMAGKITIVSLSETPVSSRPWSTRTSSSLKDHVHVAVQLAVLGEELRLGGRVLRGERAQHLADVLAGGRRPPSRRRRSPRRTGGILIVLTGRRA